MDSSQQPDPKELVAVETTLFNRMLRNAFIGFLKGAAFGAVVGLIAGAALTALGIPLASGAGGLAVVEGAFKVAAWLGGAVGSFGAVAGIQSTRDTRRFFLMHESSELSSPEHTTERALVITPERDQPGDRYRQLLAQRDEIDPPSLSIH